jgi:hypothetical protein
VLFFVSDNTILARSGYPLDRVGDARRLFGHGPEPALQLLVVRPRRRLHEPGITALLGQVARRAMGKPMLPRPMNPTSTIVCLGLV